MTELIDTIDLHSYVPRTCRNERVVPMLHVYYPFTDRVYNSSSACNACHEVKRPIIPFHIPSLCMLIRYPKTKIDNKQHYSNNNESCKNNALGCNRSIMQRCNNAYIIVQHCLQIAVPTASHCPRKALKRLSMQGASCGDPQCNPSLSL